MMTVAKNVCDFSSSFEKEILFPKRLIPGHLQQITDLKLLKQARLTLLRLPTFFCCLLCHSRTFITLLGALLKVPYGVFDY